MIIRENCKIVFRWSACAAIFFLFLIPYLYGISNLSSEKAADCLGKLVVFIGIPLFVPILKPEQDSDIRDVIIIKEFPYHISIFFRMVFAAVLSFVMIYSFVMYMQYKGCEFPIFIYTVRAVGISILIGGTGVWGSAFFRRTLAGVLMSVGFVFLFYDNFTGMVLEGIPGFVLLLEVLLYGSILLLCKE